MTCGTRSLALARPVFTDGTTTDQFIAFHRTRIDGWTRARISRLEVTGSTGGLTVGTALRYGNVEGDLDGDTGTAMSTQISLTADNLQFGGDFQDLSEAWQIVEFGVLVRNSNTSYTDREMAHVGILIDLQQ